MRNILLSTALLTLIAAPAMAQSYETPQITGSIGYTKLDGDGADLGAITARAGTKFNRYFGAEGEFSVGVTDDDVDIGGATANVEHVYDAAAYVVGTFPVGTNLEIFGRVGYGTTKIKASAAGVSSSENEESVNYGAGANYFFDGRNGVRADWTRRDLRNDAGDIDTYGLSFVRRF